MAGLVPAICRSYNSTMGKGYVYMLATRKNGVIYIGVTNNLAARIHAHKSGKGSAFTRKYGIGRLVWYESYDMFTGAIQRETTMKHWPRQWKINLIERESPEWDDLHEEF